LQITESPSKILFHTRWIPYLEHKLESGYFTVSSSSPGFAWFCLVLPGFAWFHDSQNESSSMRFILRTCGRFPSRDRCNYLVRVARAEDAFQKVSRCASQQHRRGLLALERRTLIGFTNTMSIAIWERHLDF